MPNERTWPQLVAVITINELMPRKKKYGHYPPVELASALAALEFAGRITRRDLRRFLDEYYGDVRHAIH